jgi:hypothetical protein
MTTLVAVSAVTGARLGRALGWALGRAVGRAPAVADVAVTQSPTLSAAALAVTVWLNVVEALKLTVVCDWDWSFSTKMFVGLTALIFPVVPGRALGAALGLAAAGVAPVVPVEFDFPLLPQPAARTTTPRATAGIRKPRRRFGPANVRCSRCHSEVGTFTVDSLSVWFWWGVRRVGFIGQSPRNASMGASRAARLAG